MSRPPAAPAPGTGNTPHTHEPAHAPERLGGAIHYRESAPDPRLAAFVQCYWFITGSAAGAVPNRVLPDGCMDIIVDLGEPTEAAPRPTRRGYFVGAMRRPIVTRFTGRVDLTGVRFRPGGAATFIAHPAAELTDRIISLDDLWGRQADEVAPRLAAAAPADRARILDRLLLRRLAGTRGLPPDVGSASALIAQAHGRIPVRTLRAAVGLTERSLERRFAAAVGLTPKMACRVARFQHAIALLLADPRIGWARLTHRCGFYDQAHLIREFKALAGLTPGAYLAERLRVGSVQSTEVPAE